MLSWKERVHSAHNGNRHSLSRSKCLCLRSLGRETLRRPASARQVELRIRQSNGQSFRSNGDFEKIVESYIPNTQKEILYQKGFETSST